MPSQELKIRKFKGSDYPDIVRLENKVFLEVETSVESLRFQDETRPKKCKHQRFVAELDDEIIGHGFYSQWEGSYQPGKFSIHIEVHPNYQGEGHGKKFYRYLLKELEKHEPKKLVCHTREDKERATRFIEDRGFEESIRMWTLELDVDDFDPEEYYELRKKLEGKV